MTLREMKRSIDVAFEARISLFFSFWSRRFVLVFFASLLLSVTWILVDWWLESSRLSSVSISHNHIVSFVASINTTYSAFVKQKITVNWCFKHQLIDLLLNMKIYSKIDFLVAWSSVRSELEYLLMIKSYSCSLPYVIPISFVTFRYWKIVFMTFLC